MSEFGNSGKQTHGRDRILVVMSQRDFLVDCAMEVLERTFPNYEVKVCKCSDDLLPYAKTPPRLIVCHKLTAERIELVSRQFKMLDQPVSVAVFGVSRAEVDNQLMQLISQGMVDGVIPASTGFSVFLTAIDLLLCGGEYFPGELIRDRSEPVPTASKDGSSFNLPAPGEGRQVVLTTREREILSMLSQGTQNKIIAARLDLSENTVKVHVRNIYKKMHVRNRTEAASWLFQRQRNAHTAAQLAAAAAFGYER